MHDLVAEDLSNLMAREPAKAAAVLFIAKRKQLGLERYGELLKRGNGRSWWRDLAEEIGDACCYARLALEETGGDPAGRIRYSYEVLLQALILIIESRPTPEELIAKSGGNRDLYRQLLADHNYAGLPDCDWSSP
jgi:hypothetical protein